MWQTSEHVRNSVHNIKNLSPPPKKRGGVEGAERIIKKHKNLFTFNKNDAVTKKCVTIYNNPRRINTIARKQGQVLKPT